MIEKIEERHLSKNLLFGYIAQNSNCEQNLINQQSNGSRGKW